MSITELELEIKLLNLDVEKVIFRTYENEEAVVATKDVRPKK